MEMDVNEEIPRELYKCLVYNKMLLGSCEMKHKIDLSREAVEQWAKEYYGEERLEEYIKNFSEGKCND